MVTLLMASLVIFEIRASRSAPPDTARPTPKVRSALTFVAASPVRALVMTGWSFAAWLARPLLQMWYAAYPPKSVTTAITTTKAITFADGPIAGGIIVTGSA